MINLDQDQKNARIKKGNTCESACALYEGWELTFNAFESRIFSIKFHTSKGIKILNPRQVIQILRVALAQVKAGNTSENLNEIHEIVYSLYRAKEITKKLYNSILKSVNV